MPEIPHVAGFDSTLALARDPYRFVSRTARDLGSDIFALRLMLRPAIALTGPEGAELFYRPDLFRRHGATPALPRDVLFGKGGIQGTDGVRHRTRKALFLGLTGPDQVERLDRLGDLTRAAWQVTLDRQLDGGRLELHRAAVETTTRAACAWAGVALADDEIERHARQLSGMVVHAGDRGPGWLRGFVSRQQANRWAEGIIVAARENRLDAPPEAPVRRIASWRDEVGRLLDTHVAAIEFLNLIRPIVAVSVFVVFCAHALHRHPETRARAASDADYRHAFVQEVRRTYAFFPMLAARTEQEIEWKEYRLPKGRRVLLDLYGTNHDPATWPEPDAFRPERFLGWPGDPFTLIPQGGGAHAVTHRCPGEWITIRLMSLFVEILAAQLEWRAADARIDPDLGAVPPLPPDGFPLRDVRPA